MLGNFKENILRQEKEVELFLATQNFGRKRAHENGETTVGSKKNGVKIRKVKLDRRFLCRDLTIYLVVNGRGTMVCFPRYHQFRHNILSIRG